ncbi:heavy metal-responsive transcriptional regulator [Rhodococcus spelaei]|uniref:Heavy metal-responsive transcriptional regulator n=1 Tax=Rhodococcus spelaei TaxID=2546320 RepID=A0A541B0T0_9NOCA|nr:heavy metal-responsive transcriptional regulator [Rhodococcus spelaei]TQF65916.1 heavy metal-responsive transcriptional regulator [Rhodococcus spelaei]
MRIGELADQSGVATRTLRFYEQSGLLSEPVRTASGYRDYGPEFVERLHFIRRAQAAGLTLREVRDVLTIRDRGQAPCGQVVDLLSEHLEQVRGKILELITLESTLESLLDRAKLGGPHDAGSAGVCWILESDDPAAEIAR